MKLTKDSKPPLPKVHSTPKKPSTPKATEVKKPTEKLIKNVKSSPRITPKATPLQSPGVEHAPFIRDSIVEIIKQNDSSKDTQDVKSEDKNDEKKDQGSEKIQVNLSLHLEEQQDNSRFSMRKEYLFIPLRYHFLKYENIAATGIEHRRIRSRRYKGSGRANNACVSEQTSQGRD